MKRYFLAKHVHFCCRGDVVIFLDVKLDRYTMISGDQGRAFLSVISMPPPESASAEPTFGTELDEKLQELVAGGILTMDASAGKPPRPHGGNVPTKSLAELETRYGAKVTLSILWAFVLACTKTALLIRFCRFERLIQSLQRRKTLRATTVSMDFTKARTLVLAFRRLRMHFPVDYVCLFDSVALVEFLARFDLYPNLIFAVQFDPWSAHCWVQSGEYSFNNDVEETDTYLPIMSV